MSYNLFLDDIRTPAGAATYMPFSLKDTYLKNEWVIVTNYMDFVHQIATHGIPNIVSFDHDLADEHYNLSSKEDWEEYSAWSDREKTGLDCMKWMVDYIQNNKLILPYVIVHSMNTVGRENIQRYFDNFTKHYNESSIS